MSWLPLFALLLRSFCQTSKVNVAKFKALGPKDLDPVPRPYVFRGSFLEGCSNKTYEFNSSSFWALAKRLKTNKKQIKKNTSKKQKQENRQTKTYHVFLCFFFWGGFSEMCLGLRIWRQSRKKKTKKNTSKNKKPEKKKKKHTIVF